MTTSLNAFSKSGLASALAYPASWISASTTLRVYPSTVPFPSTPTEAFGTPLAGSIVTFTGITWTTTGGALTASSGSLTATSSAAGTLSWWSLSNSGTNAAIGIISDSLSLNGGTGIVFISNSGASLTVTSGQVQTLAFNLQLS